MKKRLLLLVSLALVCAVLTGCGSGNTTTETIPMDSPYIGVWEATRAEYKDSEVTLKEVIGDNEFIFSLFADGVAEVISDGETQQGTWKITGKGISIRAGNARSDTAYIAKDNTLVLSLFGVDVIFTKR